MMNKNAHVYLCGDGNMSNGVQETFKEILTNVLQKSKTESDEIIKQWKGEKRYQMEIWS